MLVILLNARLDTYIHDGHSEVLASLKGRRGRRKGERKKAMRNEEGRTRVELS